jgi:SPP1 family phage portal protein
MGGIFVASYNSSVTNEYGRETIFINQRESDLVNLDVKNLKKVLESYIPLIVDTHERNKTRIRYLWDYYLGVQDIRKKVKHTRQEINNKKTENWAYAIIDFKKAWQLGNPIQYVMVNEVDSEEIEQLNKYARFESKESKDQLLYEDILVTGRGYRYHATRRNADPKEDAPFEIHNLDRDCCEVVYSNGIGHEQLFSVIITDMKEIVEIDGKKTDQYYEEITIYTRNRKLVCQYRNGTITWLPKQFEVLILQEHIITEYFVNRDRISLIEIGKNLFDGINELESMDFDDMEQFVNSLMVFTNAEVNEKELDEIKTLGAVSIKSTENKKASVELLQSRLNATETQTFYTRLLVALHQILGIPMATDSGTVTSGDTGKAKMTGQGYTSAGIRAKTDETMFKACDLNALKVILKICRRASGSKIKDLYASEIESKMNRDMSDNLLVKTQGLMNLLSANVPKEYAVPIINLFSDANAVVKGMEKQEKEQIANTVQTANEQNNLVNNINEKTEQEQ